jgi:D-alanyl-D-alanine carboxypeptidase/D-alanyl-D-alanine-endopeptidase (penicillin-binding protein 4)
MAPMNRRLIVIIALVAAVCRPMAPALAAEASPLAGRADAAIARWAPPESHVGVSVIDVATGETVYAHQATKLYTPASLVKLLTSGAALAYLGAQKRFATRLLVDGPTEGGLVRGHLMLKGEGDPTLAVADLDAMAARLKAQGIKTVTGDVVADAGYFQPKAAGAPGWAWDDLVEPYAPPVSALSLSHNIIEVGVAPALLPGEAARVTLRPMSNYLALQAKVTTVAPNAAYTLDLIRQPGPAGKEAWQLRGSFPAGAEPVTLGHAIADPARFAAVAMKEALERQGIQVHGTARLGTAPANARAVVSHQSAPLADIVRTMNKESDNLIAETLLFHLGVRGHGAPGTREKGLRILAGFLERAGWPATGYRLEDGSGLSRYDAVTPAQLTALLRAMPAESLAYPAYLISLPVGGIDGTLAGRMGAPELRGRMRAKTGTMSGVSGLAGYLTTESGRTLAVAIMVNGFVGPAAKARELQDALVKAIAGADDGL